MPTQQNHNTLTIHISRPLGETFMDGKAKHLEPLVSRTPREVLPGKSSFDHDVLRFLRELSTVRELADLNEFNQKEHSFADPTKP